MKPSKHLRWALAALLACGSTMLAQQAAPPAKKKAKRVYTNDDFPQPPPPAPAKPPATAVGPRVKDSEYRVAPFIATPIENVREMLKLADLHEGDVLYDLGSGDGRVVNEAALRYGIKGVGIEINADLVEKAKENARQLGVNDLVTFLHQDLFKADISKASVVTLYLLSDLNQVLRPKLLRELKPGSRVLSYSWDMGKDWKPDKEVHDRLVNIYLWVIPPREPE